MKKITLILFFVVVPFFGFSQIDGNLLLSLNHATTAELSTINPLVEGVILYNSDTKGIQLYNGAAWADAVTLPPDILDGDDDTTYTAGNGLVLTGTTFSINNATIAPDWSNITNIPTNLDTDITNEIQALSKSGNSITLSNGGGSVTETETSIVQNQTSGIITYNQESGGTSTAKIISTDANNAISIGTDGGAYFATSPSTTTIKVDQSFLWAGNVNDTDIHSNGTLTVAETRSDTGWSFGGPSTIRYSGEPDHVKIDLMAVANNTGNHWAHPHIKVFRNGNEIGEGSGLHMDDSTYYSGRTTTMISMVDSNPGTNPVYTFTTLEDDTRTMNNPTIQSLSPVSLIAVEKVDVVITVTN